MLDTRPPHYSAECSVTRALRGERELGFSLGLPAGDVKPNLGTHYFVIPPFMSVPCLRSTRCTQHEFKVSFLGPQRLAGPPTYYVPIVIDTYCRRLQLYQDVPSIITMTLTHLYM